MVGTLAEHNHVASSRVGQQGRLGITVGGDEIAGGRLLHCRQDVRRIQSVDHVLGAVLVLAHEIQIRRLPQQGQQCDHMQQAEGHHEPQAAAKFGQGEQPACPHEHERIEAQQPVQADGDPERQQQKQGVGNEKQGQIQTVRGTAQPLQRRPPMPGQIPQDRGSQQVQQQEQILAHRAQRETATGRAVLQVEQVVVPTVGIVPPQVQADEGQRAGNHPQQADPGPYPAAHEQQQIQEVG